MEYVINDFLKPVFKPGDLENPFKKEMARTQKKKALTLEEYARYIFIDGANGFWIVNNDQETPMDAKRRGPSFSKLYEKIPEAERETGAYGDWPGLLQWCRCYVLSRSGYETAALNHIATLKAYIREDAVLRLWAGDLQNLRDLLKRDGVDVEKYKGLWDLPKGLGYGFNFGDTMEKEYKIKAIRYATKSIIAMIKFLRLGDVFLGMLGKVLKFDPAAFTTNTKQWNRIVLELGGFFQYVEMFLLQKKDETEHTPGVVSLEKTKNLWRAIIEEIRDALKHEWTFKELKPLRDKIKGNPFKFYGSFSDVDFILEIFGAEKDY